MKWIGNKIYYVIPLASDWKITRWSALQGKYGIHHLKKNWNIRKACYTLIDRQKQIGGEGRGEWKNKTLCVCVTGDCCPSVCPMRWSGHGKNCSTCSLQPFCERGFHVILRPEHVQMGDLQLPRDSADIFLKLALLQVGQCQNVCW